VSVPRQSVLKLTGLLMAGALWLQGFCTAGLPADAPSGSPISDSGCHGQHHHDRAPASPASPVRAQKCCGLVPVFRPSAVTFADAQLPVMIAQTVENETDSPATLVPHESDLVLTPPPRSILRI
jgi:hypothetical protein